MDKEYAEKEIKYQSIKLLLLYLEEDRAITHEEARAALHSARDSISPLIGILDEV